MQSVQRQKEKTNEKVSETKWKKNERESHRKGGRKRGADGGRGGETSSGAWLLTSWCEPGAPRDTRDEWTYLA